MPPSFSGKPHVLASICAHLPTPDLARMIRVDRECFHIAGKALYRYLIILPARRGDTSPPISSLTTETYSDGSTSTTPTMRTLLDMVETIDITEPAAVRLAEHNRRTATKLDPVVRPYVHRKLRTVVLRAEPDPDLVHLAHRESTFGEGWEPKRLVFVGNKAALQRTFAKPNLDWRWEGREDARQLALWPSVVHFEHIFPLQPVNDTLDHYNRMVVYRAFLHFDPSPRLMSHDIFNAVDPQPPAASFYWSLQGTQCPEIIRHGLSIALGVSDAVYRAQTCGPRVGGTSVMSVWVPQTVARALQDPSRFEDVDVTDCEDNTFWHGARNVHSKGEWRPEVCDAERQMLWETIADGGRCGTRT